ncbi:TPA: hypothetical protein PXO57_004231 [Yersinia enterocolitica]|nr:hypothetical protein [Yersinia enterocolitica]HDL7593741.1 hypothetical protein [Yersinia enterocolitica]HDX9052062.1 hypothetical protein [Yersinia enterocolitica]HEI6814694.1 hypothetical protein [Yersinia enterocolitica]
MMYLSITVHDHSTVSRRIAAIADHSEAITVVISPGSSSARRNQGPPG